MTLAEEKKGHLKQPLYIEVIGNLEKYLHNLSITYMPVNGTYFYYINKHNSFKPAGLFQTIEIVLQKKDYTKAVKYFDGLNTTSKIVAIRFKSGFSYYIDGINVIRFDLLNAVNFPGDCLVPAEELFSRGIKSHSSNVMLPSPEDALLLLICKSFHLIDRFFDYSILMDIKPVITSENFSWDWFRATATKRKIRRFSNYFLSLYNNKTSDRAPRITITLYQKIISSSVMRLLYNVIPGILKKVLYKVLLSDNPIRYLYKYSLKNVKRFGKKTEGALYAAIVGKFAKKYVIENENIVFNAIIKSVRKDLSEFQFDFFLEEDFIIGTSSGLWYLKGNTLYQITYASSYGITREAERWYANQNTGQFSRILSFNIDTESEKPQITNPDYFSLGLPRNVHQIDMYDNIVYVIDTINNRIITVDRRGKKKHYFPNKSIKKGKNNNHFNSIFITGKQIYVCAHNGSLKPKHYSEIYVLNKNTMKTEEIIQTGAGNAHNIIVKNEKIIYCDSMAGRLFCDNKAVFEDSGYFMRGLAMTGNYVLIGGSQFARREERASTDGVIFVLDKNFKPMKTFKLKNIGQVYEIRGVNGDYGLSAYKKNNGEPFKQQ